MSETDYAQFETRSPGDRTVMNILYGLHTFAPFTGWALAVIALIINYIKRGDEQDALYVTHHNYMITTFWWSLLWLVVTGPLWLIFVVPGMVAWCAVGAWYLYRCIRGWLRFSSQQPPR